MPKRKPQNRKPATTIIMPTPLPAKSNKKRAHGASVPISIELHSAHILQRFWRRIRSHTTTLQVVKHFLANGPTPAKVKAMSFQDIQVFIRDTDVIATTKACLQRLHLLCIIRHGFPQSGTDTGTINIRMFLAAYLFVYFRMDVLESMGETEVPLVQAATSLLESFDRICDTIARTEQAYANLPNDLTEPFSTQLFTYLRAFNAWKVPDLLKLIKRIKVALHALYQARATLPADEPADSQILIDLNERIESLRSKLLRVVATPDALTKFDEELRASGVPTKLGECASDGYGTLPDQQLAHELLLDPTFQMDDAGFKRHVYASRGRDARDAFHAAFWDSLTEDLQLSPPYYERILDVLKAIREGFFGIAFGHDNDTVEELLDLPFIRQQLQMGLYDWTRITRLVTSLVEIIQRATQSQATERQTNLRWTLVVQPAMQAAHPSADADEAPQQGQEQPKAFCMALEFLLDRVCTIRMDHANMRLPRLAQHMQIHGIEYEQGKFQDKLNAGTITLERTTAWIRAATQAEALVHRDALLQGNAAAFVNVHTAAILALVEEDGVIDTLQCARVETAPETLSLDVRHLQHIHQEFKILTTATIMLVSASHVLSTQPATVTHIAKEIFVPMSEHRDTEHILLFILSCFAAEYRPKLDPLMQRLRATAVPTDAVHRLIATRIKTAVRQMLVQPGTTATALHALQPAALLMPRFEKAVATLRRIIEVNRAVHLELYNRLISEAVRL